MTEPVAYLNGRILPAHLASLPIDDAGFVLGATVTEQLRTFRGRLFRPERHLERLRHSLDICGINPPIDVGEFGRIAGELAGQNHPLLAVGDDLGLAIFVTPGALSCDCRARIASDGRSAHVSAGVRPLGQELSRRRVARHDFGRAGAAAMLARRAEMPQPHALLSGRQRGERQAAWRTPPVARRNRSGERDIHG